MTELEFSCCNYTFLQAQKAILDQELDLITQQNTGEDTTELKKKVEELKQEVLAYKGCFVVWYFALQHSCLFTSKIIHCGLSFQAKSLGLLDPPSKGRGRGTVRGRGRGTPVRSRPIPRTMRVWTRDSASLDHRPKQITVGEITQEQKEDVSEHFRVSTKTSEEIHFLNITVCPTELKRSKDT